MSHEQLGIGINRQPVKQFPQLWPKAITAQGRYRMKFAHVVFPFPEHDRSSDAPPSTRFPMKSGLAER
jgi:hypothetical protein